ncbi:hypothetical protein Hypma_013133 [Hypsizygus marmoreus]|uniref:F-box domain-containing protein n=1 Tax=Hypsizygus marmoreus TaxID=39966 RepID=A0A369JJF7_HYPMA|nr:hypothetical protein Hypma_013133 [Hypsizygus marmoreus]
MTRAHVLSGFTDISSTLMMAIEQGLTLELVDQVISNLRDSPKELSKCALVCRQWLPLARSHKLHTVKFNERQMGKLDRTVTQFVYFVKENPHFTLFLFRTIDVSNLARLEKVSLNFMSWVRLPSPDIMKDIKTIFELPSLKYLVLHSPIFEDAEQFAQFFDKTPPNIMGLTFIDACFVQAKDCASARSLTLPATAFVSVFSRWHSFVATLRTSHRGSCTIGEGTFPILADMFKVVSPTLRSLELSSPSRLISSEDIDISPTTLPNLIHLTINNIGVTSLPSAVVFLSQLTSANSLESITPVVDIPKSQVQNGSEDMPWKRMDEALEHVQDLKSLDVIVKSTLHGKEREHAKDILRGSFQSMALHRVLRVQ